MCHHEIGQYDFERLREATSEDAEEPAFGTEEADEPEPEEPTVVSADD
jgi:hypothetical protein